MVFDYSRDSSIRPTLSLSVCFFYVHHYTSTKYVINSINIFGQNPLWIHFHVYILSICPYTHNVFGVKVFFFLFKCLMALFFAAYIFFFSNLFSSSETFVIVVMVAFSKTIKCGIHCSLLYTLYIAIIALLLIDVICSQFTALVDNYTVNSLHNELSP